jgi:hypothetical protein
MSENITRFWKSDLIIKFTIGCGGLLLLCCICGVIGGIISPSASPRKPAIRTTPTHTVTMVEFVTEPPPTNTPASTDTLTPEPTAGPTDTPTVALEPTTGIPPEVQAYFLELSDVIKSYGEASIALSKLFESPRLLDNKWRFDVSLQLGTIRFAYHQITEMEAPPEVEHVHNGYLTALESCNEMTIALAQALDTLDKQKLDESGELLKSCNTKFNKANKTFEEYMRQYQLTR